MRCVQDNVGAADNDVRKAVVAKHPEVFRHAGLLVNEPLGTPGLLII